MALVMVTFNVLRIPCSKYAYETYTVGEISEKDIIEYLTDDKNVVNFYRVD